MKNIKIILQSKFFNLSKENIKLFLPSILSMNYLIENKIGRWKLSNNINTINIKVDQANEDHCGCCNLEQIINEDLDKENYYSYFCT
jgi:hypothetical protein